MNHEPPALPPGPVLEDYYRYVGDAPFLQGETAIGCSHVETGKFYVQVDRPSHRWSHGWHETLKRDWEKRS